MTRRPPSSPLFPYPPLFRSLGTVLYEMATGRRAFDGKTKTSLIAAIVSSDPAPMSQIQPLTPPAFEHVVAKCLAKERDDRRSEEHTSELQSRLHLVCRLLLE